MSEKKNQAKLHELLAVESDLETTAKKIMNEATVTFLKKQEHFLGYRKSLRMFEEHRKQEEEAATESKALVTTVGDKLEYVLNNTIKYYDAILQKEATNQTAVADLVVDGHVLLENAPATWLLGMESRLKGLRTVYEAIPTWAPGVDWVPAPEQGKGIYKAAEPSKADKTEKAPAHKVLVPASEHHPAQVEKWVENVRVGVFTTQKWISSWSPSQKSEALERLDKLIRAIKRARQRANSTPVVKVRAGSKIRDYLQGKLS